jgi:hypothetical protein
MTITNSGRSATTRWRPTIPATTGNPRSTWSSTRATPGDSLLFGGELDSQSISARVTAPAGTTLYYLCALHPWMQGSIKVRR